LSCWLTRVISLSHFFPTAVTFSADAGRTGTYQDIPSTPPLSPTPFDDEDIVAKKSNEIRIGQITRARAKLLE
jgi:hypothetical protein